jgi:hypothetical protein
MCAIVPNFFFNATAPGLSTPENRVKVDSPSTDHDNFDNVITSLRLIWEKPFAATAVVPLNGKKPSFTTGVPEKKTPLSVKKRGSAATRIRGQRKRLG